MLEVRLVPEDAVGLDSFANTDQVLGKITRFPIAANEQILPSKLVTVPAGSSAAATASRSLAYTIPSGMRGFAVKASPVMNGGGLVLPGDYVDIMVIYSVEFQVGGEREEYENFLVQTIFQNIEVLAVSQTVVDHVVEATPSANGQRPRNSEARPDPEAGTVTLALTPEQAQRLYLAEANGSLRFSVRPYGESEERPIEFSTEVDLYPRNLPNPFTR
jgi:pilus assembly protein CpaB